MERPTEQSLVRDLSNGSVIAFNELYKLYCDLIYNFSFSLLKDPDKAEEVVQCVFIKVWEKRSTLKPELSFRGYICTITKNFIFKLLHDSLKQKEQTTEPRALECYCGNNRNSKLIDSEIIAELRNQINNLSYQRRRVFILRRRFKLSNREIADHLMISGHTVKRHMNMAMKTLSKHSYN